MIEGTAFLDFLRGRRSVRRFSPEPVRRETLARLIEAAITAPSATNRQPWRFAVVTSAQVRASIVGAIREETERLKAAISESHHAKELDGYSDFFHEPLERAPAFIVPQSRIFPDLIAELLISSGKDPKGFTTPGQMPPELCAASGAVMALLLQAYAEGLGACWMAGPTVARSRVQALLGIEAPWQMLGAIAVGHPEGSIEPPPRKPLDRVASWYEDGPGER